VATRPEEHSALYKTWVILLNGYGYNWYRQENQLRADDLVVRERAGHFILEAAKKLQEQESAFARKSLPAPTRANPFRPRSGWRLMHACARRVRICWGWRRASAA
jgi:hypothetical protein